MRRPSRPRRAKEIHNLVASIGDCGRAIGSAAYTAHAAEPRTMCRGFLWSLGLHRLVGGGVVIALAATSVNPTAGSRAVKGPHEPTDHGTFERQRVRLASGLPWR
jgi:hypothetical protein